MTLLVDSNVLVIVSYQRPCAREFLGSTIHRRIPKKYLLTSSFSLVLLKFKIIDEEEASSNIGLGHTECLQKNLLTRELNLNYSEI